MDAIEQFEVSGNKVKIVHDECPESPREWDNLCEIHCAHRRYKLGDFQYDSAESLNDVVKEAEKNNDVVLPLYLYDHSGISISLSNEYPYNDRWDAGQVGFVIIRREKALNEFGKKVFNYTLREKVLTIARDEVKVYDQYLRGEVYGFQVEDKDGNDLESCYGIYGLDECRDSALESIPC